MMNRSTFTVEYISDRSGIATEIILVIPHIVSVEYDTEKEVLIVEFVGNARFMTDKLNHSTRDIEGDLRRAINAYYK